MRKPNACCDNEDGLKKGLWTSEEDKKLLDFIERHGHGSWRSLPEKAGLQRCGKSCRLRWRNYLRPDIKRGKFTWHEEQTIIQLHALLGNRWSAIANMLPKRTDNEIKNHWNTHLKKRLIKMGIDPLTHKPKTDIQDDAVCNANLNHIAQWESARVEAEARLAKKSKLITTTSSNVHNKPGMSKADEFRPHLSSTTTISWKNKQQPLLFIPPLRLEDYIFKAGQPEWKFTNNNNALESPTSCLQFSDNNNIHRVPITFVPSPAGFGENSVLMNPPEVACVPDFMEDLSWINDAAEEVFNITGIYNVNDNNNNNNNNNNNVGSSFCSGNLVDNMKYWNTMF